MCVKQCQSTDGFIPIDLCSLFYRGKAIPTSVAIVQNSECFWRSWGISRLWKVQTFGTMNKKRNWANNIGSECFISWVEQRNPGTLLSLFLYVYEAKCGEIVNQCLISVNCFYSKHRMTVTLTWRRNWQNHDGRKDERTEGSLRLQQLLSVPYLFSPKIWTSNRKSGPATDNLDQQKQLIIMCQNSNFIWTRSSSSSSSSPSG